MLVLAERSVWRKGIGKAVEIYIDSSYYQRIIKQAEEKNTI
jgi:hypothetical protein